MSESPNLNLPYLLAAQAQKHVTHNEALDRLDAVVQLSVLSSDLTDPPLFPQNGDRYIIALGATGDWSGKDGQLTGYFDGQWQSYVPNTGWICWDIALSELRVWDGVAWTSGMPLADAISKLGINAAADVVNRLSVSSDASLFNHDGNDHQLKVNKNSASDTASLLFQKGFVGHAEFGLMGDNDFRLKTSADGITFFDAMHISSNTGVVDFPAGISQITGNNFLQNGSFEVAQRGTIFSGLNNYVYHFDRWNSYVPTGYTVSRVLIDHAEPNSPRGKFANRRQRLSGTTTHSGFSLEYPFTADEVIALRRHIVTVSGKIRRGTQIGTSFPVSLIVGNGAERGYRFAPFDNQTTPVSGIASVPDANQWFDFAVTGSMEVASDASQMSLFLPYYPVGTAGADEWVDFADLKLELGNISSPYSAKPYEDELWACSSMCTTTYLDGQSPGVSFSTSGAQAVGRGHASGQFRFAENFPRRMHVAPSVSIFDQTGAAGKITYYETLTPAWIDGGTPWLIQGNENQLVIWHNIAGAIESHFSYLAEVNL